MLQAELVQAPGLGEEGQHVRGHPWLLTGQGAAGGSTGAQPGAQPSCKDGRGEPQGGSC